MEIVMGIIILVLAVALIACVMLQSGKEKSLSGSIAGSAEGFGMNGKARAKDKILARITTVLAIIFTILVVVTYIMVAA